MISDDTAKTNISENLRTLLAAREWSVLHFARELSEPQNTVYRIVRGDNVPGVALLARMAELLDVSVDDLLLNPRKFQKVY